MSAPGTWINRTEIELLQDQLHGLDLWNESLRQTSERLTATREMKLAAARRADARRHEHRALIDRCESQMRESRQLLSRVPPRVVIAHRNEWFRSSVTECLAEEGVITCASVDDGADAVAAIVLEQPDLILVEDLLPTVGAAEVVRRGLIYAPKALVAVQVDRVDTMAPLMEAGASAVFARRIPPAQVAHELVSCLGSRKDVLTCL